MPEQVPHAASYITSLLASAPADVRTRLAQIGDFVISEENLSAMRGRSSATGACPRVPSITSTSWRPGRQATRTSRCGCTGSVTLRSRGPA